MEPILAHNQHGTSLGLHDSPCSAYDAFAVNTLPGNVGFYRGSPWIHRVALMDCEFHHIIVGYRILLHKHLASGGT